MKRLFIAAAVIACLAFSTLAFATTSSEVAGIQIASAEGVAKDVAAEGEKLAKEYAGEMHAEEGGHGAHEIPWNNFFLRTINFVIFIGLIVYLAGGKAKAFFGGRRVEIKKDLDDLQARQAEAEKKLKEVEKSIANLEQEKKAILDEALKQGETLRQSIIEKANVDAVAIREQAKRTAANEAQGAIDTMRAEMADMVIKAAEKIVQEKLSDEDHDKLVDEYLTKVVLN